VAAEPVDLGPDAHLDDVEVRLTAMRRRHLRGVLRIEHQVYPRPWSVGLFMSELALRTSRVYVVARVGPNVVGYAGLLLAGDEGHVTTIAVEPMWHRHKIGTRLLLQLTREALAREITALTLEVRVTNEPAKAMYQRFGYAPAGVRKGYYIETGEDALIMWAHDVAKPTYAERLRAIEATIPGRTTIDDLT
jgi:[ribosomal protein S18]-alanine N-acetyltransferase